MDDILVYLKTPEDHLHHCVTVIKRIFEKGGTINKEKSEIFLNEINYLGVKITEQGLVPDNTQKLSLSGCIPSKNTKELQKIIGTIN